MILVLPLSRGFFWIFCFFSSFLASQYTLTFGQIYRNTKRGKKVQNWRLQKVFTKYKISKVLFQAVKRFWPWLGTKGSRNGRNQIDRRLLHTHTHSEQPILGVELPGARDARWRARITRERRDRELKSCALNYLHAKTPNGLLNEWAGQRPHWELGSILELSNLKASFFIDKLD